MFIDFDAVSESDFLTAVLTGRPRIVLDLRLAPRFDLGTLNRRLVFSIFDQIGAQYYDVAGKLEIKSLKDAKLNPALLVPELRLEVFKRMDRLEGPVAILVAAELGTEEYERLLAKHLEPLSELGWELLRIPHTPKTAVDRKRQLVFVSHANPQDNDFALWLVARLSSLGYLVWSDVTDLVGGQKFWDEIEEAIQIHAARVVVCLSRAAQTKEGVLDEISCAIGTERSRGLEGFVVPIRLDDLPYTEVRANLGRKNIIDFSVSWTSGLLELVKAFEQANVPRPVENGPEATSLMASLHGRSTSTVLPEPESVFANWLTEVTIPNELIFLEYSGTSHDPSDVRKQLGRPTFVHYRLLAGFVAPDEAQRNVLPSIRINHRASISTADFLAGRLSDLPGLRPKEARNHLTGLLREAWDSRARAIGLLPYQTAAGTIAWYVPKNLIAQDTVQFLGPEGQRRRKLLVGRSEKRNVFWHFAIEAKPSLQEPWRFVLRPHVIFTEDGQRPLQSNTRMHALRRGFCKSWWNDRWRDLMAAYACWLAAGASQIELPVSDTLSIRLSSRLMELTSPVRLSQGSLRHNTGELESIEPDWVDDPEIDDAELMQGSTASPDEIADSDDDDQ